MASVDGPASKKMKRSCDSPPDLGLNDEMTDALKNIHESNMELESLTEQCALEILDVERKFNKLRKPFYEKRTELVKKIPGFWLRAFVGHPSLLTAITKEEMDCLAYIDNVEVEDYEEIQTGYFIKIHFDPNPFIGNDVLMKDFQLGGEIASCTATEIKWKPGHEPKTKNSSPETFFELFSDTSEAESDLFSTIIRDEIWPNPLRFCTEYDETGSEGDLVEDASEDDSGDDDGEYAAGDTGEVNEEEEEEEEENSAGDGGGDHRSDSEEGEDEEDEEEAGDGTGDNDEFDVISETGGSEKSDEQAGDQSKNGELNDESHE